MRWVRARTRYTAEEAIAISDAWEEGPLRAIQASLILLSQWKKIEAVVAVLVSRELGYAFAKFGEALFVLHRRQRGLDSELGESFADFD